SLPIQTLMIDHRNDNKLGQVFPVGGSELFQTLSAILCSADFDRALAACLYKVDSRILIAHFYRLLACRLPTPLCAIRTGCRKQIFLKTPWGFMRFVTVSETRWTSASTAGASPPTSGHMLYRFANQCCRSR